MSENARSFGLFIDGLRLERNLSREELINDIVSLSQYKRYLRGATSIPNSILIKLADRLKLSISGLHNVYESKQNNQLNKIFDIYSLLNQFKFKVAYTKAIKIRDDIFISSYNKLFFDFCLINIQHNLNMVSDIHALGMYSSLINYPDCINQDTFNWIEINIFLELVKVSAKIDNFEPSNQMYKVVTSSEFKFISSGDSLFIPTVLSSLAPILGKQQKYEEVLNLANEGIEYCKKYQTSAALATLYLTGSFALNDLERIDEAKEYSKKALMQVYIEENNEKLLQFKRLIAKRLDLSEDDLKFC